MSAFPVFNRDQRSLLLDLAPGRARCVLPSWSDSATSSSTTTAPGWPRGSASPTTSWLTSTRRHQRVDQRLRRRRAARPPARLRPGHPGHERHHARPGGPDEADSPVFLTVPVNDVIAAGLGALGACAALLARARTGPRAAGQRHPLRRSCLLQSEHLVRLAGGPADATAAGTSPAPGRSTGSTRLRTGGCGSPARASSPC